MRRSLIAYWRLSKILQNRLGRQGCVKLTGSQNDWRIRIGDWRVIYSIIDKSGVVDIVAIRHRSDAYR